MMIWDDIARTALIGSERAGEWQAESALGTANSSLDGLLGQLNPHVPEDSLLSAAAIVSIYRRAGDIPARIDVKLPEPAPEETQPECSEEATRLLAFVVDGEHADVAPEALRWLKAAGKRLSPVLLPELLDFGRQREELREDIADVVGRRGFWLSALNSDWDYLTRHLDIADWPNASRSARVATMLAMRKTVPEAARRLLLSTWQDENAEERAELLSTYRVGLSQDDEEFLESALDDRSKEVKNVAADLLCRLPNSRLVGRIIVRVRPLVNLKYKFSQGHTLEIQIPDTVDADMKRDGIDASASGSDEGRRASCLRQLVAAVPPSYWSKSLQISPREIVALAGKSEWSEAFLMGLSQSVSRSPDAAWTLPLLDRDIAGPRRVEPPAHLLAALRTLPTSLLEERLTSVMDRDPLGAPGPLRWLLPLHTTGWSHQFSRHLLAKIKKTLEDFSDNQTQYVVAAMLRQVALRIPPNLADELAATITFAENVSETLSQPRSNYLARATDEVLSLITFRRELQSAIMEDAAPRDELD